MVKTSRQTDAGGDRKTRSKFEIPNFDLRSRVNGGERSGAAWGVRSPALGGRSGLAREVGRWPEVGRRSVVVMEVYGFYFLVF